MSKYFNICNIYVCLWCIFRLKGWLYQGDMISTLSYGLIMIISLYYTLTCFSDYSRQPVIKWFNILVIMFTIYGVINILLFDDVRMSNGHIIPTDFFLQNILRSMLPFYAFYAFTKKGYITKRWLCIVAVIILFISIPRFYIEKAQMLALLVAKGDFNATEVTNNAGYLFSAAIPLFCFWNKRPIVQYLGLAICIMFILAGMKRGAILVAALSLMFILYKQSWEGGSHKNKMLIVFLSIALVFVCYKYFAYMTETSAYFLQRVEETKEGNTSSRDVLYGEFWDLFWHKSNPLSFLIGMGADGTIRNGRNFAHNDWLEIAIDHGILGVTIFFVFWGKLYKFWKSTKKYDTIYIAMGACLIQLFAKTFFSMAINDMEFYTVLILGYCVAIGTYPNIARNQDL